MNELFTPENQARVAAAAGLGQPPMSELITWHEVAVEVPDSNETVLGFHPQWSHPVWGCYLDGKEWHSIDGARLRQSAKFGDLLVPTHWATWPFGPVLKGGAK